MEVSVVYKTLKNISPASQLDNLSNLFRKKIVDQ
jgi:hypothetical protein